MADVSEEFVPLFSTERYADRVKEIVIPTEKGEITYYLLSLIEHKTQVDYNIHMQIFRYMVYIWERHERECERKEPGCTRRKDFRYPPILPIVYYEGRDTWTASPEFKDRILLGDEFKKYLPNFSYYMVPVHTYTNEDLLEHGDGISFVMLFNRMQTMEDVERFREIPPERLEALVKGLPEYQVEIAAMVFRAFLRKENVPEEETEELVGKVKEKRMAELFGNMEKMDIQAERRNTREARERANQAEERAEKAENAIKEEQKKVTEANWKVREANRKVIEAQNELLNSIRELGGSEEYAKKKLCNTFALSETEAQQKVEKYWDS